MQHVSSGLHKVNYQKLIRNSAIHCSRCMHKWTPCKIDVLQTKNIYSLKINQIQNETEM